MRNTFFSPSRLSSPSPSATPNQRTFSASLMDENLEIAQKIINTWDLKKSGSYTQIVYLFSDYRTEAKEFLRAVTGLQTAMHFFLSEGSSTEKLIRAQGLMQIAVQRLEREFFQILTRNRDFPVPESVSISITISSRSSISSYSDDDVSYEDPQPSDGSNQAMSDLKSIADCMISIGYGKECVKIYKLVRKSIVDESLYNLGLMERLSLSQMQKMEWETIEVKIKAWLKAVKIAVNSVFHGERVLCDHVFSYSATTSESCFSEITIGGAQNLFTFPENVAKCKKLSPEKMFRILDLYNTLSELLPEIEFIFAYTSTSSVKSQALTSVLKLREAVRAMLIDFEAAIQKEFSKSSLPGGGVHPLTRYVMNYLSYLSDYEGALNDIIEDWPLTVQSPLPESYFPSREAESQVTALSVRLAWIILVLLCKLDAKAEQYREVSLSYLFLANNLNYVVSKVKSSNLKFIIGDEWLTQHESKVKQYASSYERMGWSKVMSSLPDRTANISPQSARDSFMSFNKAFVDTCKKQATWTVPGPDLRAEIKASLGDKIVPLYRGFYERYREMFSGTGGEELIVKFAPEDIERYVWGLFNGTAGSDGDTSSSH